MQRIVQESGGIPSPNDKIRVRVNSNSGDEICTVCANDTGEANCLMARVLGEVALIYERRERRDCDHPSFVGRGV